MRRFLSTLNRCRMDLIAWIAIPAAFGVAVVGPFAGMDGLFWAHVILGLLFGFCVVGFAGNIWMLIDSYREPRASRKAKKATR